MNPQAGDRVLDACAAPGGKATHLAELMGDQGEVWAIDRSAGRLQRVAANAARLGTGCLQAMAADAAALLEHKPNWRGAFQRILLDAPCTATGTIRRHPDLPFVKDGSELEGLVGLQKQLIDRALGWVRPGGRLVYSVCSLLPAEGEAQVADALKRHDGVKVDRAALDLPGTEPEWLGELGLRLRPDYWPDTGGMDGFFISALCRD